MTNKGNREVIVSCLRHDLLRHIVTLKMLRAYGESMELRFVMEDGGWALLSLLPARVSEFDRQAYPEADLVVLVDGSSDALKEGLLEGLPPGQLVARACDGPTRRFAAAGLPELEAQRPELVHVEGRAVQDLLELRESLRHRGGAHRGGAVVAVVDLHGPRAVTQL